MADMEDRVVGVQAAKVLVPDDHGSGHQTCITTLLRQVTRQVLEERRV